MRKTLLSCIQKQKTREGESGMDKAKIFKCLDTGKCINRKGEYCKQSPFFDKMRIEVMTRGE